MRPPTATLVMMIIAAFVAELFLLAAIGALMASFSTVKTAAFADLAALGDDFFWTISRPVPLLVAIEANIVHCWATAWTPGRAASTPRSTAATTFICACILYDEPVALVRQAPSMHFIDGILSLSWVIVDDEGEAAVIFDVDG